METTCRCYLYVRAEWHGADDIRFQQAKVWVHARDVRACSGDPADTPTDDDWALAALDHGHDATPPVCDDVQWNDTVVQVGGAC